MFASYEVYLKTQKMEPRGLDLHSSSATSLEKLPLWASFLKWCIWIWLPNPFLPEILCEMGGAYFVFIWDGWEKVGGGERFPVLITCFVGKLVAIQSDSIKKKNCTLWSVQRILSWGRESSICQLEACPQHLHEYASGGQAALLTFI